MEAEIKAKKETPISEGKKGKRKWLSRFATFLMFGRWLLVVFVILGIITLISILSK